MFAPARDAFDLANLPDSETLDAVIANWSIAGILNCGAYTAVDRAESEAELAMAINGTAPKLLAQAAARAAIPILHVSTDYVFDGKLVGRAYREDDPVDPQNVYGRTKLVGEQGVATSGACHVILRTAWVVSAHGNNFVKTMLRLGVERDELGIVADQIGCPTAAADIAEAILSIAARYARGEEVPSGTYHFVNAGNASWYDLAAFVFKCADFAGYKSPSLSAITTADYPTPALRPANSRLATDKMAVTFGLAPRPWQDAIGDIVSELLA